MGIFKVLLRILTPLLPDPREEGAHAQFVCGLELILFALERGICCVNGIVVITGEDAQPAEVVPDE